MIISTNNKHEMVKEASEDVGSERRGMMEREISG